MLKVERARRTQRDAPTLFRSFWLASFDAVDHLPGIRLPGDGFDVGEYAARVEADYATVSDAGIACVRESIDWRRIARDGGLDFESVLLRAERARSAGLQIVWTLCQDGWPDDLDVCSGAS